MKNNKPHFLLIHGAWHGGWVWNEISEILRYQRYSVSTPTLTGLGEKKHLLSSKITNLLATSLKKYCVEIKSPALFDIL